MLMKTFDEKLESYAELAIRLGVNIQKDQLLVIDASVNSSQFVGLLAEKAYDAGAKSVHVEWSDATVERIKLLRSSIETLSGFPEWKAQGYTEMAKEGAAFINVQYPMPEVMNDVPADRISAVQRAAGKAMQEYRSYRMTNKVAWLGIAMPTQSWANIVYPDLPEEERLPALWETVFRVTRADQIDPVEAWENHINMIKHRLQQLNEAQYKCLRYTAKGTDLTIELPNQHIWVGGGVTNDEGVFFVPNIPTEECFTAPLRTGINGTVRSTKPLFSQGKMIKDFSLTFKDGRIVDFSAEEGYETLKAIIETDEGSHYLGEVALVPNSSPISGEGVIFYNTLYDENASCHIAIGAAYPINIEGGSSMTKEQLLEHGINHSMTHVDFMIGSSELDIDGLLPSGEWVPIFRKGEWA